MRTIAVQPEEQGVFNMSKIQVSPYINFQGQAREAMEFYQQVLGGTLDLQTMDAQGGVQPAGPGDRITHARLEADDARIVGGDGHPAFPVQTGENLALALGGTDHERLARIFHELAAGGTIKQPLRALSGGGAVGWLMDPFGINWMVQIDTA
jgi:PhnB protein